MSISTVTRNPKTRLVFGFILKLGVSMKRILMGIILTIFSLLANADNLIIIDSKLAHHSYESYLNSFTYEERKDMKINSVELTMMLEEGSAQLIDIRFKEEFEAWHMKSAINIPLNELPGRLNELDKTKPYCYCLST